MQPTRLITVDKDGVPPGRVLLEDAAFLTLGIHDAIARLIQRQLGFPGRTRLRNEAKRLTTVALAAVSTGSGVLECEVLPAPGVVGRPLEVMDNDDLHRRIHPTFVRPDGRISSQAFRDVEMSVNRARHCEVAETLAGFQSFGVASLPTEAVRSFG